MPLQSRRSRCQKQQFPDDRSAVPTPIIIDGENEVGTVIANRLSPTVLSPTRARCLRETGEPKRRPARMAGSTSPVYHRLDGGNRGERERDDVDHAAHAGVQYPPVNHGEATRRADCATGRGDASVRCAGRRDA